MRQRSACRRRSLSATPTTSVRRYRSSLAQPRKAFAVYSDFGSDIPAMKDINAFKANNKVEKEDVYYMKGWMEGVAISKAIEAAIAKNGGKVTEDIQAFRKGVSDELDAH